MNFYNVAEHLNCANPGEINANEWLECGGSRRRSAVSRAYYAAFRELLCRLGDVRRIGYQLPRDRKHAVLIGGTERALPNNHLGALLKALRSRRSDADYEFGEYTHSVVDALEDAYDALELIEALTRAELEDILFCCQQVDAEISARRR